MVTATSKIPNNAVPFVSDLSERLTRHAEQQPDRIAVGTSDLQTTITYRQLDTLVRSAMAQLSRMGLKRGNTVALLSDNSVEFVLGLLTIMFSGSRVAPLNPALTSNELSTRLSQLSANALLVTRHVANKPGFANSLPQNLPYCITDLERPSSSSEVRIVDKQGRTPATGGTTKPNIPIEGEGIGLLMLP